MSPLSGHVWFGVSIACFASYQQFKLPVVLPALLDQYSYDPILAGAFMSVFAVLGLTLSIPLGGMVQARGPGHFVRGGLALTALGCGLGLAFPGHGLMMLLARTLEGGGFAVLAICGPAIATRYASPAMLPVVLGIAAAWIPAGQLVAAAVAPLAEPHLGWSALWWLGVLGAAVLIWISTRLDLQLNPRESTSTDSGATDSGSSQEAHDRPLTGLEQRCLVLTAGVFLLWSSQYFAYMTWLPEYLVDVYHLSLAQSQLSYAVPVAVVVVFNVLTGYWIRLGCSPGTLLVVGMVIQAGVWWWLPHLRGGAEGIFSLIAYGVAAGLVPATLFVMPSAVLGPGRQTAWAFGVIMTGRNLGVFIGPLLSAFIFKWAGGWSWSAPVFASLTTLATLVALSLALSLRSANLVTRQGR